jgi:hypothetical protein
MYSQSLTQKYNEMNKYLLIIKALLLLKFQYFGLVLTILNILRTRQ